jgi:hypothetical protein
VHEALLRAGHLLARVMGRRQSRRRAALPGPDAA